MNVTFVTSWYNLNSKLDKNIYKDWMKNLLLNVNNFNLVIYTNKESYNLFDEFIENNSKIKVIFKEWEDFYCYKWVDKWIENHKKNDSLNDKSMYNTEWKLNMLWNEKISFVNETKEKNIFESDWYGWCDIGYFRGGNNLKPDEIKNWPNNDKIVSLDKDKIYYGLPGNRIEMKNVYERVININENNMPKIPIPKDQVTVAGGFFISHKKNIDWWFNIFYNKLENYFLHKYLVKDDQMIIIDCIFNNLNNFIFVEEKDIKKDRWFVFQSFLL